MVCYLCVCVCVEGGGYGGGVCLWGVRKGSVCVFVVLGGR